MNHTRKEIRRVVRGWMARTMFSDLTQGIYRRALNPDGTVDDQTIEMAEQELKALVDEIYESLNEVNPQTFTSNSTLTA